jgi:hypothetical protein
MFRTSAHLVAGLAFLAVAAAPVAAHAQDPVLLAIPTYTVLESPSASEYARSVTNKTISATMTKLVMPALTHEDPHYYRRGGGRFFSRVGLAARGSLTFSEIGGTAAAAGLSNLYYSPADRTVSGTLTRWGTQMLWDTVANEAREFWPEIRTRLLRR